jgi:hypothetical protein
MISHPTTDLLLHDCCRELDEQILPAIADETVRARLVMTMTVLATAATRAAHEIAWMREETSALVGFARTVEAVHGAPQVTRALDDVRAANGESLHLHDVADVYARAGRAFEAALVAARDAGADDLVARAAALLRDRVETERAVAAGYSVVGR